MIRYAVSRILVSIPLLLILVVLSFFYVHVIPGDPVSAMVGTDRDPELIAALNAKFGLDQPLVSQFWNWITGIFRGDLGFSYQTQFPVSDLIFARVPPTVELAFAGLLVMLVISIPLGISAGLHPGSRLDRLVNLLAITGLAIPGFFLGYLLLVFFTVKLRIFPSVGYAELLTDPGGNLLHLALPAVTLGLSMVPYMVRLTREATIDVARQAFVPYAQAKGLPKQMISRSYVLRNVLPRLVAIVCLTFGGLLGGAIIVEALFTWPGMGQMIGAAVSARDYPIIQAIVLLYGATFIVVNLIGELLQAALDPRIRLQ